MSQTPNLVLQVESVSKSFGSVQAVEDVSVSVAAGETVALLGPNGAGKTTLLRMIIRMIHPDQGTIRYRFGGREADRPDPERVGYLPEDRGLYQDVPVQRILLYFAALRGMSRSAALQESQRWLERLELADRANEELRNFSKGNQQKIQFITSILHRPELAVLDEPFSGLDPLNQDFFLELIRELSRAGTAVLFSAHQMQLVERLADRVMLIRQGRAASEGSVEQLRARWGAGRRLRLRAEGDSDASFLLALPGVRDVTRAERGEIEVLLADGISLSGVLEAIGQRLDVRDLRAETVTLHDIYIRTLGASAVPAQEEVGI